MKINPFMIAGAVVCAGAGVWALYHGNYLMSVVYFSWAVADVAAGLVG